MATALTVGEFRALLERFADALESGKANRDVVRGVRDLSAMFSGDQGKSATTFFKAARKIALRHETRDGPTIGHIVPVLASLSPLVGTIAKKSLKDGLDSLLDVLRSNADVPISVFGAAVRQAVASASKPSGRRGTGQMDEQLLNDYVKRLEAALGEDREFKALLEELQADSRIDQSEAVTIACRFYGRTPKSASRAKALARIRERHEKLMEFKGQPSTAGRSAA